MKKIKLLMPLLVSTTLVGTAIATIGCDYNPGITIKTIDFNTCDWVEVIAACDKLENGEWTEEQFCQRFKFGDVQATKLEDFAGKERTVLLNGLQHKVMVLGSKQDYLDKAKQNPVALTFQFINLISAETTGKGLSVSWNDDGTSSSKNYDYWNSTINKALNDDIGFTEWKDFSGSPVDEDRSVMMMIHDSDSVLYKGIKNVSRTVLITRNEGQTWAMSTSPTKLFCPCLGNYFSDQGINNDDILQATQATKDLYCLEAMQYQYYDEALEDERPSYASTSLECMDRKDLVGAKLGCWLATPYIYGSNGNAWRVNDRVQDEGVDEYQAITPCFCI